MVNHIDFVLLPGFSKKQDFHRENMESRKGNVAKAELIADLKAMSLEISSICGTNHGLQSDSGFIDENRNDSGKVFQN